jgi:hypothetical protein
MSWFSREWDGVHMEGCPLEDTDYVEHDYDGTHTWISGDIGRNARYVLHGACGRVLVFGDWTGHECQCPELMVERAVSAADAYQDRIDE